MFHLSEFSSKSENPSGIPISRISKGNENRFKKQGIKLQNSLSKGNEVWLERSGGLRNGGVSCNHARNRASARVYVRTCA